MNGWIVYFKDGGYTHINDESILEIFRVHKKSIIKIEIIKEICQEVSK